MTEKKSAAKSEGEKDAGVEVPEPADADHKIDASGDGPIADFDKHTKDVKRSVAEQPKEDEPHGHPMDPTAEPILVTEGGGSGQLTRAQREANRMVKIDPVQAYEDPDFNPVAAAEPPGHRGGPQAEGGTERQSPGVDVAKRMNRGHDEKAEDLNYDWKGTDPKE